MEFQVGDIVRSKAGRDEGAFLAVVGIEDGYPLLCDGKHRPLERPKRKNPLHLAGTNRRLDMQSMETNRVLRRALRTLAEAGAVRVTKGG